MLLVKSNSVASKYYLAQAIIDRFKDSLNESQVKGALSSEVSADSLIRYAEKKGMINLESTHNKTIKVLPNRNKTYFSLSEIYAGSPVRAEIKDVVNTKIYTW